jgi:hypothetical protein
MSSQSPVVWWYREVNCEVVGMCVEAIALFVCVLCSLCVMCPLLFAINVLSRSSGFDFRRYQIF